MSIRKLFTTVAISGMLFFAALPARAGIPVIDGSNLAQQIQQVLSWGQQAQQMLDQINKLQQQFQQLQTMTQKLDGGRGLGSILQNPAIANALPPEMRDAAQLLLNPSAMSSSPAAISSVLASFGITQTGIVTAAQGNADALSKAQAILAASQQRQTQLQSLGLRVDGAADAKESLDLLNRNTLETASIQNQMMQTMASIEAAKQQQELAQAAQIQRDTATSTSRLAAPVRLMGR
ncbi:type IV secretion system protein [Undibacterium sp.]|uniref:type IV secretion system protein n=1 Tax=Undibacterium sp. TaxID=1914977 RepID=UPI0037527424